MPVCCIVKCGARKKKNQSQLSLHRFPKNDELRKKWLEAIGEENINPRHQQWYLCSLHFEDSCVNRTLDVMRLHDNSVPTILLSAPVLQSSSEAATADSTHEETHSDDSVDDADEAASQFVFSWEKPYDAIPCAEKSKSGDGSSSVLSCAGRDDYEIKSESDSDKLHLDFKCNECGGEIIGYRYTCVQCCDFDLCGACEASGAHPEHYVLRLPRPEPAGAVKSLLEAMRRLLDQELPLHLPQDRIKMEVDDEDPLYEPTGLRSPEPTNDDESDDYESEGQEEEKCDLETISTDSKETHTDAIAANTAQMQHQTNEKAASIVTVSRPVNKISPPLIRVSKPIQVKTLLLESGVEFGARVGPGQIGVARTGMAITGGVRVAAPTLRVAAPTVRVAAPTVRVAAPTVRVAAPTVRVAAPTVRVAAPTVRVGEPTMRVTAPTVRVAAPTVRVAAPTVRVAAPLVRVAAPTVRVAAPTVRVAASMVRVAAPTVRVVAPTVRIAAPTVRVGAPAMRVAAPTVRVGEPTMRVTAPTVRVAAPTVGVAAPTEGVSETSVRLTEADVKLSRAGTTAPGTEGMVSITAPKRTALVKLTGLGATALEGAKRRKVTLLRKVL